jgi:formate dehydrogenase major subunit/NADH-quinone oxidoreductase subunit G
MAGIKNTVTFTIDGREIKAAAGENLLWCALDSGLYIPNLCAIRSKPRPQASCRLCFVEVEGLPKPVTACTTQVRDGMKVRLNTPHVKRIRNTAFEFLLSYHHLDCAHCPKNGRCGLQEIAAKLRLKMKLKLARKLPLDLPVDSSHKLFYFDPNRCVLCGRCVWECQHNGAGVLDFAFRGLDTRVSTFASMPLADTACNGCLACVDVCPVAALVRKDGS